MRKSKTLGDSKKLVCVLAVHNEEEYLPYSLGPLRELGCLVVAVLDRCVDSSGKLIKRYVENVEVVFKETASWKNSYAAEAKNLGCDVAKELGADMILMTDADVLLDVDAVQKARSILASSNNQIVVLPYWQYSLFASPISRILNGIQNLFASINRKLKIHPVCFGVYVGEADVMCLEDVPSEYDVLQHKVRTTWINTKGLHLRPRLNVASQIKRGEARATRPKYTLLKVMISSLFILQPFVLVGYLKAKIKK